MIFLLFSNKITAVDCDAARQKHFPELEGYEQSLIFTSKHLLLCKPNAPDELIPTIKIESLEAKPESNELNIKVTYKATDGKTKQSTFVKKCEGSEESNPCERPPTLPLYY